MVGAGVGSSSPPQAANASSESVTSKMGKTNVCNRFITKSDLSMVTSFSWQLEQFTTCSPLAWLH
jgi:hypothetical protein